MVVGHVRGIFFVDYEDIVRPNLALKALYLLTGLGHQSVVVFFVLSGFFVGSSALSNRTRWSWRRYLLRRSSRLYVVLIPALLLTALLDRTGMALFGTGGVYGGQIYARYLTLANVSLTGNAATFMGNLLFLQGRFVDSFGSNGPLWSLPYEFWSYMLFPLCVQALARTVAIPRRALHIAIAIFILCACDAQLFFYFPVWLIGAAVAAVWQRWRCKRPLPRIALRSLGLLAFAAAVLVGRLRFFGSRRAEDAVLGIGTGMLLMVLLITSRMVSGSLKNIYGRFAAHFASFSFTLYAVHFPALLLINAAVLRGGGRWLPDPAHLISATALCAALVWCWGWPVARLTEAHTDVVRMRLGKMLEIE